MGRKIKKEKRERKEKGEMARDGTPSGGRRRRGLSPTELKAWRSHKGDDLFLDSIVATSRIFNCSNYADCLSIAAKKDTCMECVKCKRLSISEKWKSESEIMPQEIIEDTIYCA